MKNTDFYEFSSMAPKIKKTIRKYKNKYDIEYLKKISLLIKESPPKFLQPIKSYRFYSDIALIDNPESFNNYEETISQLELQMNFKSISKVTIGNTVVIEFEDKFSKDYCSLDLFVSRLNSLSNEYAHQLAMFFSHYKKHLQIEDPKSFTNEIPFFYKNHMINIEELLEVDEIPIYDQNLCKVNEEMSRNEKKFTWKISSFFIKKTPYLEYGHVIHKIEFNRNIASFFYGKEIEQLNYQICQEFFKLCAVVKEDYFKYFLEVFSHLTNNDSEHPSIARTFENLCYPCHEKVKVFYFNGKNYEEKHFIFTISLEEKYLNILKEVREKKRIEELKKDSIANAKLYCKYRKIPNVQSDDWKVLCLLYHGSQYDDIKTEDNEENEREKFWKNVDQSKVCKYKEIEKNEKNDNTNLLFNINGI